jgi:hypothetical protein
MDVLPRRCNLLLAVCIIFSEIHYLKRLVEIEIQIIKRLSLQNLVVFVNNDLPATT